MKAFSSAAIIALKEALIHIYWKRQDLRDFVYHTIQNKAIVSTIDWGNNAKAESAHQLIDRMLAREDIYKEDLLRLFDAVIHFNDYSHLEYWDDADSKINRAKKSVEALRTHAHGYFSLKEEEERAEERKRSHKAFISEKLSIQQRVTELKNDFISISMEDNPQKMNELFILFDLDPKESFKIVGEQIDGAFTYDNQDYLLEAKWTKGLTQAGDLYDFGGKISGKFKIALGLFISINGFSPESIKVDSPIVKSMILMDGMDLIAILDNRISLKDMLYRKRRHAVEKGEIYFPFSKF